MRAVQWVDTALLASRARAEPTCDDGAADDDGGDRACISDVAHLNASRIFLARGE